MNKSFFSVVIPTHNRPHLFGRAIASVIAQDFDDYELIVVNDGSHLSYDEVMEKHGARIRKTIVHEVAKGVSEARNSGVAAASGKWVVFLDDDDEFTPGFLRRMHERLKDASDDIGFSWASVTFQMYDPAGNRTASHDRKYEAECKSERELYKCALTIGAGFGFTVKREIFDKAGLFDPTFRLGEDTEFVLRLLANGYKPVICPEVGVIIHTQHMTHPVNGLIERVKTKVFERLAEKHLGFIKNHPEILCNISGWGARLSYACGDFSGGDRLLFPMLRAAPFNFSVWLFFVVSLLRRAYFRMVPRARLRAPA